MYHHLHSIGLLMSETDNQQYQGIDLHGSLDMTEADFKMYEVEQQKV